MTPLSWQPPPVTNCRRCVFLDTGIGEEPWRCDKANSKEEGFKLAFENHNNLTESCPMWQQQNKDKT